jgi:hypothetical protein
MTSATAAMLQAAVGVILVLAATAKIANRTSLSPFLVAAGVPVVRAMVLSRTMPAVEGVVGLLLLAAGATWWAAAPAALLTSGFAALLIFAYRRGITEGCHCFGMLDGDRLSVAVVGRTVFLACASLALVVICAIHPAISSVRLGSSFTAWSAVGAMAGAAYISAFALFEQVALFQRGRQKFLARPAHPAPAE